MDCNSFGNNGCPPIPCESCVEKDAADKPVNEAFDIRFSVQRKEKKGWRAIGFPALSLNGAIERCEKLKVQGFTVRVIKKQSLQVW